MKNLLYAFYFLFLIAASCDYDKTKLFEIVYQSKTDPMKYEFVNVHLPNIEDIRTVKGANFIFESGQRFSSEMPGLEDENIPFHEHVQKIRKLTNPKNLSLDLSFSDGVYKANSFESLLALSSYYSLENVRKDLIEAFDLPNSLAFSPCHVGIFPLVMNDLSIPDLTNDNAFYWSPVDSVFFLGVGDPSGLPFVLNTGVIAHEFFHRVFFYEVNYSNYRKNFTPTEKHSNLIRGLNEGLADLAAVIVTGNHGFLNLSLTGKYEQIEKEARDLNGKLARVLSYEKLQNYKVINDSKKYCHADSNDFSNKDFNPYCFGTLIARTLLDAAGDNITSLKTHIAPKLKHALKDISLLLQRKETFEVEYFLNSLGKHTTDKTTKENFCKAVALRFSSIKNKVTACNTI